jgi:D-threonate/D-erythronate kinase
MTIERPPTNRDAAPDFPLAMLADDLTGGCDAGVQFSLRGLATRVYLDLPREPAASAGVSVLVNHCRGDSAEEAARKVRQACDWIAASGMKLSYKKIDSTMKGNVGAELEAVRNKFPDRLILVSPSFPKMGRILIDGWLKVHSGEAFEAIHVPSLLTGQGAARLAHISQPAGSAGCEALVELIRQAEAAGSRIVVIDAVSESHLRAIAEAATQIVPQPLLVGSAGLAAAWSELLLEKRNGGAEATKATARFVSPSSGTATAAGPVVLCIGSTNSVTTRQLQRLAEIQRVLTFNLRHDDPNQAQAALGEGFHLAVPLPPGSVPMENLRRLFSVILDSSLGRGLLCSGGDTARLVCTALGVRAIQLGNEVLPGLPWGTLAGGPADGLPICTKAGGFGDTEALCHAVNFLAAQPRFQVKHSEL